MGMYIGNRNLQEGWEETFFIKEMYGSNWFVFIRDNDPEGRYLSVKLLSEDYVENKANYWLSWDTKRSRLTSRGADAKLLKDNRPELHKTLFDKLKDWF